MAPAKKKDMVSELKKLNLDLEKHMPKLNYDFLEDSSFGEVNDSNDKEFMTLLATNFADLRTEVALMRKSIMSDTESMIMRILGKQQREFMQQTNDLYGRIIIDMKSNFASFLKELAEEVSAMRKDLGSFAVSNDSLDATLKEIKSELVDVSSSLNGSTNGDSKIDAIAAKIEELVEESGKKTNSGFVDYSKKFDMIYASIVELRKNYQKSSVQSVRVVEQIPIAQGPVIVEDSFKVENSRVERLLNIDNKLKKLEMLR